MADSENKQKIAWQDVIEIDNSSFPEDERETDPPSGYLPIALSRRKKPASNLKQEIIQGLNLAENSPTGQQQFDFLAKIQESGFSKPKIQLSSDTDRMDVVFYEKDNPVIRINRDFSEAAHSASGVNGQPISMRMDTSLVHEIGHIISAQPIRTPQENLPKDTMAHISGCLEEHAMTWENRYRLDTGQPIRAVYVDSTAFYHGLNGLDGLRRDYADVSRKVREHEIINAGCEMPDEDEIQRRILKTMKKIEQKTSERNR